MKNRKITNIIVAGVGGQGTLLASDIISKVAMKARYDVKKSEVHGMAQRGGSVISHVRFGQKVYSPLIQKRKADFLIAFEKLEALRYIDFLKRGGRVIMNNQEIIPMTVYTGDIDYPAHIEKELKRFTKHLIVIDALDMARALGNKNVVNVVMLGLLSSFLEFEKETWEEVLLESIPKKFIEVNKKAFSRGHSLFAKGAKH